MAKSPLLTRTEANWLLNQLADIRDKASAAPPASQDGYHKAMAERVATAVESDLITAPDSFRITDCTVEETKAIAQLCDMVYDSHEYRNAVRRAEQASAFVSRDTTRTLGYFARSLLRHQLVYLESFAK